MTLVYDPIRKKKVAYTPEERVRQTLLRQMLDFLSFPKGLIAVEKQIGTSLRRFDIVVYQKNLAPLLLIECKASPAHEEEAFRQAVGYAQSPFWCIAHPGGIRTFWRVQEELHSVPFLPPYPQLLKHGA